jgi:Family of unknown function (DUF5309)
MAKVYSTDLVGKRESVVDEFLMLNEHQTPLLSLLGFSDSVSNVEHVWFEDEMFAFESTAAAAALVDATTITVADAEPFRAGQIVKIGEELLKVTSVSDDALTVTRGYAETVAAAVSAGDTVEVLFNEGEEGRDARQARYKARSRKSNITQIFDESVELSGTAMAVNQFGVDSEYEKEKQKKQLELALQLEKALINGVKFENGTTRMMRGIRSFIESNIFDGKNELITDEKLNEVFQAIYESGGFETGANYKIMVPATQKTKISNLNSDKVRIDRLDNGRGQVVDHFISDFGQAEIVLNNNLAADELIVMDTNRVSVRPLQGREFAHTYMGQQGDYKKGMLVGEYTAEILQEKAHGRIKGLKK